MKRRQDIQTGALQRGRASGHNDIALKSMI